MSEAMFVVNEQASRLTLMTGESEYPLSPIWLREFSSAPEYLDARTQQRLFATHTIDPDLEFSRLTPIEQGVDVEFSDGYRQVFELQPLINAIDPDVGCPPKQTFTGELKTFDADGDDAEMLEFFLTYGFAVIRNVGTDIDSMERYLARKQLEIRTTNFGRLFEVRTEVEANDLAYTSVAIGPHTDNPYRDPVPTIQCLHCLKNEAEGGESTLMDSMEAIRIIQREQPEYAELLLNTPVRFWFTDADAELSEWRTIFERNQFGEIAIINYSPRLDFAYPLPPEQYRRFHQARQYLNDLLNSDQLELRFKLKPGELMIFDNRRMLHGRTGFDPASGARHLRGCYVDIDAMRSAYRISQRNRY